jgi:magnesium chelatase accessory protein
MNTASRKSAERNGPVSRFVQADGLRWHLVEQGQGPVILLVHGTAASVHSWRHVMPLLASGYQVVAVDLPGHGHTLSRGAKDLSLERMARGLGVLMDAMRLAPVTVAGHSAGAAILVEAAARKLLAPETLVAFNGAFYPFGGVAGSLFSPVARMLAFNSLVPRLLSAVASRHTVQRLLRDTGSNSSQEDVDFYFHLFKDPAHVAAALGMMAAWDLTRMDDALARVEAHCIFVVGDRDTAVPPETSERAAARCRSAKALHFQGYGHLLHEEDPDLAARLISGSDK